MNSHILIVGAGFSGAVIARELAEAGYKCLVVESREHVAGNCHTSRDPDTGIMKHQYGPHIFNTNNEVVWNYVKRFGDFVPYINRVKAATTRGVFSLPINLHTINQFFGKTFNPAEARAFIDSISDKSIMEPANFEEQALKFIGRDLYAAFFHGYTKKQWGCDPKELPASILTRLPVRFNYDDNYYNSRFQGIPREGYTAVIERILSHENITVKLSTPYEAEMKPDFIHVFFTGPIDFYFKYSRGRLGYRTVFWKEEVHTGDFQGNAVINYPDTGVPYTRIHEHKHFAPWESHEKTNVFTEFSMETGSDDIPYYPKRLESDKIVLAQYQHLAEVESGVTFAGRLATYRYMDMHHVIDEAITIAQEWINKRK